MKYDKSWCTNLRYRIFPFPNMSSGPLWPRISPSSPGQPPICFLSPEIRWHVLELLYRTNHAVCLFAWLLSLVVLKAIHVLMYSGLFYELTVYPFICGWILGYFQVLTLLIRLLQTFVYKSLGRYFLFYKLAPKWKRNQLFTKIPALLKLFRCPLGPPSPLVLTLTTLQVLLSMEAMAGVLLAFHNRM